MQGYKETKIGWLPDNWEVKALGELGSVVSGLTYSPTDVLDNGLLVLRSSNVNKDYILLNDNVYVSHSLNYNPTESGDVLICVRNGSKNLIGKTARINKIVENVAFGAFMAIYRSKLNDFIYNYFKSDYFFKEVHQNLGATINSINNNDLKKFKIALPPLKEQKAIADCLSSWDKAIELQRELILSKEVRKKSLAQQLLTGKRRLPGFTDEWKESKLGELFKERNETRREDLNLLSIGQQGVYPQSESNKRDISNVDKSKYRRITPGDIGYNTMRMWQGRSALSDLEGIVSPAYTILIPNENVNSYFFSILFKMGKMTNLFWRNSQGLVDDTLNCKYKDFSIIKCEYPSIEEQNSIEKILKKADQEIQLEKQKLANLQQQKKALMQQLLTGKVRLV